MTNFVNAKKEGKEMKNPREQTTIRIPAELKEMMQQEADRKGISFNQLVLLVLKKWITQKK